MAVLADGTTLSRYTIVEKLATGGMAEVYLATQSGPAGFSKQVVLKVILPHLAEDQQFVQMFHNEAKLAALLNHSGIVQIFDFGVDDGVHFIAMEHIHGANLRKIMAALGRKRKRMPQPLALRVIGDTCRALHYAHTLTGAGGQSLQIVHRDVSLENILVSYSGQVKVLDFGIAKARTIESFTSSGVLKGKFEYMPPEVIEGETPDHRMDIYAAGVVLYLLLLGRAPFVGQNEAQLMDRILVDPPPRPRRLDPTLPEGLERILLRSLDKNPDARFATAQEMAVALDRQLVRISSPISDDHLARFVTLLRPPAGSPLAPAAAPPHQPAPAPAAAPAHQAFPTPQSAPLLFDPTTPDAVPPFLPTPADLPTLPLSDSSSAEPEDALDTTPDTGDLAEAPSDWPAVDTTEEMLAPPTRIDSLVDPAALPTIPVPPRRDEDED